MIAFPLPAAAAELPAGVQQILQQSELTPDKLVHITLQELLQTLAGWLKNAWGQPLQLARRTVVPGGTVWTLWLCSALAPLR